MASTGRKQEMNAPALLAFPFFSQPRTPNPEVVSPTFGVNRSTSIDTV